ncbi:unnamed protein product, partial [Urochloa humidicola]
LSLSLSLSGQRGQPASTISSKGGRRAWEFHLLPTSTRSEGTISIVGGRPWGEHKMELVNVVSGMDRVRVLTYKDKDVNWMLVRDILWRFGSAPPGGGFPGKAAHVLRSGALPGRERASQRGTTSQTSP